MALARYGAGIILIAGKVGGDVHKRDKSGNHVTALKRHIRKRTPAQARQRNAFAQARAYSKDPRVVSYNIYRALNGLPMAQPPIDYQPPHLQEPKTVA